MQKTKPEPCDNELYLYSLIHYTTKNESVSGYNKTMGNCSRYHLKNLKDFFYCICMGCRPFIVQRVSGSNMVLLVINNLCQEQRDRFPPSPDPQQVDYNMSLPCFMNRENYPRRLYMSCISRSANVSYNYKLDNSGVDIFCRRAKSNCAVQGPTYRPLSPSRRRWVSCF